MTFSVACKISGFIDIPPTKMLGIDCPGMPLAVLYNFTRCLHSFLDKGNFISYNVGAVFKYGMVSRHWFDLFIMNIMYIGRLRCVNSTIIDYYYISAMPLNHTCLSPRDEIIVPHLVYVMIIM